MALKTAAQYNPSSPGTNAALIALEALLSTATSSGLIKGGAAACNLGSSMRQQLQQASVLQPLAVVMAAVAADLRSEAATPAGLSREQLYSELPRLSVSSDTRSVPHLAVMLLARSLPRLMDPVVRGSGGQFTAVQSSARLCDPSGHPEAAITKGLIVAMPPHPASSSCLSYWVCRPNWQQW